MKYLVTFIDYDHTQEGQPVTINAFFNTDQMLIRDDQFREQVKQLAAQTAEQRGVRHYDVVIAKIIERGGSLDPNQYRQGTINSLADLGKNWQAANNS